MNDSPHSVDAERIFPAYQAVTFVGACVLFAVLAQGASCLDAARNLPPSMEGSQYQRAALRAAARAARADEIKRVCRGRPMQVQRCAEAIRARAE